MLLAGFEAYEIKEAPSDICRRHSVIVLRRRQQFDWRPVPLFAWSRGEGFRYLHTRSPDGTGILVATVPVAIIEWLNANTKGWGWRRSSVLATSCGVALYFQQEVDLAAFLLTHGETIITE